MSREEVKIAISELLDNSSEEALKEVFHYLKAVQGKSNQAIGLSQNLRRILSEDRALLERLAQ